jgi:hypothetical protein
MTQTNLPSVPTAAELPTLPVPNDLQLVRQENADQVLRALRAAETLLTYEPETLTAEQDEQVAEYLVRVRRTVEQLKRRREPLTRAFDAIRTAFVQLEATLDPTKTSTVPGQLQALRDAYAARIRAQEVARQEELRQRILADQRRQEELRQLEEARQREELWDLQMEQRAEELQNDIQVEREELERRAAEPLPEVPKGRAGVRVEVTDPRAYVALLSLFVEREHRTAEQWPRLTLAQLVTWAERLATSTGEVLEVEGLHYAETFRTVAR